MNAGEGPPPALDVLSSSEDQPRGEDRLRNALQRTGVLAWMHRHRPLVGGLAAVLVVVAAGAGYVVTRPPPVDPVVDVTIAGFSSGTSSDFDALGRSRAELTYQLTVHRAGDVDTAVGIVGPGLSNPTSSISRVKFGLPRVGTLGATVDCTDSRWWAGKDADYRARVRRTDTYGRVTTYDAPLRPAGAAWHFGVRRSCLRTFVATMPLAIASASVVPDKHKVVVMLTLTNPSRHALWVQAAPIDTELVTTTGEPGPLLPLPARGTASVEMSIRAADCASGTPQIPIATDVQGVPGQDIALPVYLTDKRVSADQQVAAAFPRVDPASTALVNRQLATLCPRHR